MITGINESKTLTKHISCECKCRFDGRKCNSDQSWNNDKRQCECKKRQDYTWNSATCNCENGKYLASIMDDSAIICDEVMDANAKLSPKDNADAKDKSNDEAKSKDETFTVI